MTHVLAGLLLGFSLIVAIGAQNLFVLRQGIRREHVGLVAGICTASDAALIVVGVSGIGAATQAVPWLAAAARWGGAAFLVGYGALAARRALRPRDALVTDDQGDAAASGVGGVGTMTRRAAAPVALTTLALTWLNPHVYLDTVFLLGSVASTHGDGRWLFAAGAVVASSVWFFGLAYGARLLRPWLATPQAWRLLDAAIAAVMVALGVSLALPVA